ncbi:MAG: T9SS type A sorting domain-containing protein [Bacteroidia bacterium]
MKKQLFYLSFLSILIHTICTAQVVRKFNVIMRSDVGTTTLWDGTQTRIYGFANSLSSKPTLPAKTLYVNEGDSALVDAFNASQGTEHTIHFHGIDLPTNYDGDPLTSPYTLMHLQSLVYKIKATHSGTYVYHCYVDGVAHVQLGMYGLFIIKAFGGANTAWTGGPIFNKSYNWLLSEIDTVWHNNIPLAGKSRLVPKYKPNYFLINGESEQQLLTDDSIKIIGAQGESIYLRTANMGYFINRIIFPPVLNATIIDSDGRPLNIAEQNDTIVVMPGERYGIMLHPTNQYTGTVNVEYADMNTDLVWNTQKIPVSINGFISVKEYEKLNTQINIYPNPASNILNVVLKDHEISYTDYTIINAFGQVVKQEKLNNNNNTSFYISVTDLENGIYFIKFTTNNSTSISKKFQIIK